MSILALLVDVPAVYIERRFGWCTKCAILILVSYVVPKMNRSGQPYWSTPLALMAFLRFRMR